MAIQTRTKVKQKWRNEILRNQTTKTYVVDRALITKLDDILWDEKRGVNIVDAESRRSAWKADQDELLLA